MKRAALALLLVGCAKESEDAAPSCTDVARRAAYFMAQGLKVDGQLKYPDATMANPPADLVKFNEELCQREPFTDDERRCMAKAADLDAWNACAP